MSVKTKEKDQKEMDIPMDDVGKIASKLLDVNASIKDAYEQRADLEAELVGALKTAGRDKITIGDRTLRIKHINEQDKIEIKKEVA